MPGSKKGGFLLIEVLVSVAILSLGLVILIESMANSLRNNETSINLNLATVLGYQQLCLAIERDESAEFQAETAAQEIEENLDKISVKISWKERGEDRNLQLESLLAKK